MKKEEILEESIWVMLLHAILRVLDKLLRMLSRLLGAIMSLIYGLLNIIVLMIFIALVFSPFILTLLVGYLSSAYDLGNKVTCILLLGILFASFILYKQIKKAEKISDKLFSLIGLLNKSAIFLRHYNPNLSGRLLQHYEKRWGMTNEEIEDYISHRAQLGGDVSISHLLPLVSQLCQLNKSAREEQEMFLSNFLGEDEIEYLFNMEYSYSQMEQSYQYWRGKEMGEKKSLMELLFKFTIEQDGIHNDEWKLLMQIMAQLKFNSRYIEYFKDRYYSLRTEFDDYERKSTSSLGEYSTASLESYYAVLGVEKDASIEEIKRAYHELAMQHHPDLPKNANRKEECEAKMMEINEAYEKVRG